MLTREEAAGQALSNHRTSCDERLPTLLITDAGQSVLLRDGRVVAVHESPDNAYDDGMDRYPDEQLLVSRKCETRYPWTSAGTRVSFT